MPADRAWDIVPTPIGPLAVEASPRGLVALRFPGDEPVGERDPEALAPAVAQLSEYFDGRRTAFALDLDLRGTELQLAVWKRLQEIPYGETTTYTRLAHDIGRPAAVRAVGAAVGRTPVPIVVPCHRALGSNGSLTGYAGGLERKRALLDLER